MQINISGHHVEVTEPLHNYTHEKLSRLKRHFDRILNIEVIFEIEKIQQNAKATMSVPGEKFHAHASSEDMYKTVDLLIDKLDRQIVKHKQKQREAH